MALNLTDIIITYQENIDDLINQLGKNIQLVFEDTVTNIDEDFNDSVRDGEFRKPAFKDPSAAPTIVANTRTIKALIKFNPKDFVSYKININEPQGIVRLKTFLNDVPDLKRCKHIVPNVDSVDVIRAKYRLIRDPVPVGLQVDRYAVSFWERV